MSSASRGTVAPLALVGSTLLGAIVILSLHFIPRIAGPDAELSIYPEQRTLIVNETFEVELRVHSSVPVNVFGGDLLFNNEVLRINSIEYNTNVADLWVEKPWYSNGEGTINFGGGTTKRGGFFGTDTLMTITFEAIEEGRGELSIRDARIILHNGLGTDATVAEPIDALFAVQSGENLIEATKRSSTVSILKSPPSTDLNGDGEQTIADTSIFMMHLFSDDRRYDFNLDGKVNTKDLSIILNAE